MSYRSVKLIKRPELEITADVFNIVTQDIPSPAEGEVLVKLSHLSLDPAMRGWMSPDENSYIPPVKLGDTMRASGIGEVVASNNEKFPVGARVMGLMGLTEYAISDGNGLNVIPKELPAEAILSVIALPGITAYHGVFEVLKPEAGQTLIVTAAAGSVGSLVGQMAKNLGLTVVGVAGTDEKCQWLTKELGFDHALNYKDADFVEQLTQTTPNGIDLFFENTGGAAQGPIFERMNAHGRIAVCGLIADYQTAEPSPGPSWVGIIKRRLSIQGFTMPDHFHRIPEYGQALGAMLGKGELKYRAHVIEGLESATTGINLLFEGKNTGKLIVKL
ncbi:MULTISPECIES: NADP-dependent oxidoreductase [Marinomonas]|uniref:NADP-dependent oxidoreductase n=1 Tax=Marinomonas arctica TaxID=383750 RepID=A0A7H1J883_9GAMM|nr:MULTISPECIES: NADP-dependent oxidoreductase [Marinomonas]MCS7486657.1 NADP-dependent oxidoreductase [Marinomonas sp. BSi20414]QNT06699.1 NADP-dependent oxidoreductase [Marinomonas arctica]GGN22850.1 NADP-dependent oxidoreductase [Marinomonas arctica]